jgi:hypothetical protein
MTDIQFYLALSVIYFAFGIGWGVLCYKHLSELLYVTLSSPLLYQSLKSTPSPLGSLQQYGEVGSTGLADMPASFLPPISIDIAATIPSHQSTRPFPPITPLHSLNISPTSFSVSILRYR